SVCLGCLPALTSAGTVPYATVSTRSERHAVISERPVAIRSDEPSASSRVPSSASELRCASSLPLPPLNIDTSLHPPALRGLESGSRLSIRACTEITDDVDGDCATTSHNGMSRV